MKKIAFLSQKGGSGKTTLAVHTAAAATEAGELVVLIDTDPQKSAMAWGDAREISHPVVMTTTASDLGRVFEVATKERLTLAIVDTAPHATPDTTQIVRAVDLVVIPVRPTAFDIAAVGGTVNIVKASGVRAVFVLSACPFRSPEITETRAILTDYGIPVSPVEIVNRIAFSRAVAIGRSVTEFDSKSKASSEIRALLVYLMEHM